METVELIKVLNDATIAYNEGHPVMSDEQWDALYFQLKQIENETGVVYPDSPTRQVIPYDKVSSLSKVRHNHPMLSLDKTKALDEIADFCEDKECIAMAKMDGLTCSLTYENGKLIAAETRGNGEVGEDILHNAKHIKNIPQAIAAQNLRIVIDGEVICTYKDFEPFQDEYRNPRNFASGSIRLLDSELSASRSLSFIAWDGIEGFDNDKLSDKLEVIKSFGFDVVPWTMSAPADAIEELKNACIELSYPIDGIVFKYNKCSEYNACGRTVHHFKGGIAYKFYDELYDTELLDIEWSMGRTGVLTPVAIFAPVEIDGATIERASLHNVSMLQEVLGVTPYINQPIRIYKANQIIPQVYDAEKLTREEIEASGHEVIEYPVKCPCCGHTLIPRNDGISTFLVCENNECDGKLINRLDHFFGKKGLDVKGLSIETFEKLINWGMITTFIDVFHLDKYSAELAKKPGFGKKSTENMLKAIEEGKTCELSQFICAIGIPNVGARYAKVLAETFETWEDFLKAVSGFDFTSLDGFGKEIQCSICSVHYNEADEIAKLLTIKNSLYSREKSTALKGKTFVITGSLQRFPNRDAMIASIEAYGGKVSGSVSKNTSYLINNDIHSQSSKNKTAQKLGIPIITEEEFIKMIEK